MNANETQIDDASVQTNDGQESLNPPKNAAAPAAAWFCFGIGIVTLGMAAGAIAIPQLLDPVRESGLKANHLGVFGAIFISCGFVVRAIHNYSQRMLQLSDRMQQMQDSMRVAQEDLLQSNQQFSPAQCEEIVGRHSEHIQSEMRHSLVTLSESAVHAREASEAIKQKLDDHDRARLTIAGTLDGVSARIARSFEGLARELQQQATQQAEAIQHIHDALAEMEGRLRERTDLAIQQMEQRVKTSIPPAPLPSSNSPHASLSHSDMNISNFDVPESEHPASVEQPADTIKLSEGPRESKTILKAIDKLRALRGS
ncbi:MAG: hypothetical protein ACKVS6_16085 [Planctomycetota bacterium]